MHAFLWSLLELSELLMYWQAEGKKHTSVFEELLLYRFFTLCDLLQHRHHHHHVLFFGSFDLNLVL
jgi:hypothetical protein